MLVGGWWEQGVEGSKAEGPGGREPPGDMQICWEDLEFRPKSVELKGML